MSNVAVFRLAVQRQRGVTLLGLMFWAVFVACTMGLVIKVVPAVNEYRTLLGMVTTLAQEGGDTIPAIRESFNRRKQVEYGVESITARDLDITKENDKVVISFAYNKEIPLVGPVALLIKFKGKSQ
jgi:Domain of unknown function (DUF4845)